MTGFSQKNSMTEAAMKRFIKAQGDLDGTCFLYSVVNAVSCLRHSNDEKGLHLNAAWRRMLADIDDPIDYLIGDGTKRIDKNPDLIAAKIEYFVHKLDTKNSYAIRQLKNVADIRSLARYITNSSVLIGDNGEHWFCIVDSDGTSVYIADSAEWNCPTREYREELSPRLGRIFNIDLQRRELKFPGNRLFMISTIG